MYCQIGYPCQVGAGSIGSNVLARLSACMLISHKGHNRYNTIHAYYVTVMTHVIALEAGQSSQGTSEPITPVRKLLKITRLASHVWSLLYAISHEQLTKSKIRYSWGQLEYIFFKFTLRAPSHILVITDPNSQNVYQNQLGQVGIGSQFMDMARTLYILLEVIYAHC